jgi:hypothetical protein
MNPPVITWDGASPNEPPVRRAYVHADCGCETAAAGDALVLLECPFRPVESTLCAGCGQYAPLDRVAWSDSGEKIAEYRQRVYRSVSFWRRMYLLIAGNAYEGAINLNLDRSGRLKEESPSLAG